MQFLLMTLSPKLAMQVVNDLYARMSCIYPYINRNSFRNCLGHLNFLELLPIVIKVFSLSLCSLFYATSLNRGVCWCSVLRPHYSVQVPIVKPFQLRNHNISLRIDNYKFIKRRHFVTVKAKHAGACSFLFNCHKPCYCTA